MPAPVVLFTDHTGHIREGNAAADTLLGGFRGRRCCEVFGRAVCRCAGGEQTGGDAELGAGVVNGICGRLSTTAVAGERVVVFQPQSAGGAVALTRRERDVLRRIALGDTDEEAATALGVAVSTVRTHLESARRRIGARTRTHAVARAMAAGLLECAPST